jgi:2-polyprenyl-3-methyl-5-hydroxy-6-metoxy-1,4-benzoquinol methylase
MSCPICTHKMFWPVAYSRDAAVDQWRREAGEVASYDWRLCRACGNAYPSKQPDLRVLARMWAINRTPGDAGANAETVAYRRFISRAGAERSYRLFSPLADASAGRFLDIACGLGETVRIFAEHGWEAEGIDADPSTEPFHRELGLRTRIGQLEDIEIGNNYDVIHIAHAIYFITDPMSFLRMVRERLAPGGVFCVVLADFMATLDPALPSYAHSFFPTAASMRYALALTGFETIFCHREKGSIFLAARPASAVEKPSVWPFGIWLLHRTKALRYALLGRPATALARAIKAGIGRPSRR